MQELSSKPDVEYIPGGATQNSVRVAQWVMRTPGSTAYFGCIGSDEYGKIMRDSASRDGVDVRRFSCACNSILYNVTTPVLRPAKRNLSTTSSRAGCTCRAIHLQAARLR